MHTPLQHRQEREHHELTQAEVVWLVDVAEVVVQKRAPRALRQAPRPQAALQQPAHLCNQRAPSPALRRVLLVVVAADEDAFGSPASASVQDQLLTLGLELRGSGAALTNSRNASI